MLVDPKTDVLHAKLVLVSTKGRLRLGRRWLSKAKAKDLRSQEGAPAPC